MKNGCKRTSKASFNLQTQGCRPFFLHPLTHYQTKALKNSDQRTTYRKEAHIKRPALSDGRRVASPAAWNGWKDVLNPACRDELRKVFRGHPEHVLAIGHFLLTSSTPLVVIWSQASAVCVLKCASGRYEPQIRATRSPENHCERGLGLV